MSDEEDYRIRYLRSYGYRAWQDTLSGGQWVVSLWDTLLDAPCGIAIGRGRTVVEAWQDAIERRTG